MCKNLLLHHFIPSHHFYSASFSKGKIKHYFYSPTFFSLLFVHKMTELILDLWKRCKKQYREFPSIPYHLATLKQKSIRGKPGEVQIRSLVKHIVLMLNLGLTHLVYLILINVNRGYRGNFVRFATSLTETNNCFYALGLCLKCIHSFFFIAGVKKL